jgi:hypothetical protein
MASYQPSHASSRYFLCACVCVCGIPACYFSHCFSSAHLSHVLLPPPPYLWDVIFYSNRQPLSRTLASLWIWIQFLFSHTNSGSISVLFFFQEQEMTFSSPEAERLEAHRALEQIPRVLSNWAASILWKLSPLHAENLYYMHFPCCVQSYLWTREWKSKWRADFRIERAWAGTNHWNGGRDLLYFPRVRCRSVIVVSQRV